MEEKIESAICITTIALAFWAMKKISESARGHKIGWKEFLFPQNEKKIQKKF